MEQSRQDASRLATDSDIMAVEINLNTGLLRLALIQYKDEQGRGAVAELHRLSGVNNIGRIITGEFTPTLETWVRLYLCARDILPPPTTESGGRCVLIGAEDPDPVPVPSSKERPVKNEYEFFTLYRQLRSDALVSSLLSFLKKVESVTKAGP